MNARKLIGIFATEISGKVQGNLYTELHKRATMLGYRLVLFSGTYMGVEYNVTSPASADIYSLADGMDMAAYLIHAQSISNLNMIEEIIEMGKRKHIPVFLYDGESTGIPGVEGVIPIDPDYRQGFAESVRHLIEYHHCRNIFMLAGIRNNKYSDDRIEMYRREMEAHGIPYSEEQIGYGDFWEQPAAAAVNKFLDSGLPVPEAICCANDSMAITAAAVLAKRGLRVPEDVLITGFDGIEDGKYYNPRISTCEPDMAAVADFVFRVLTGTETADRFLIPLIFRPKESCGCGADDNVQAKLEMPKLYETVRVNFQQHYMLSTMQFDLLDCTMLEDLEAYAYGILDLFKGYSHILCFREDIERHEDYKEPFDKMKVIFNYGFPKEREHDTFTVGETMPQFDKVLEEARPEDILLLQPIHAVEKKYGYLVSKVGYYSSNELNSLLQFCESFTIVVEGVLRNLRLNQANRKLSEMYERMSELYIRDMMTGLYNRHGYYQYLDEYCGRMDLRDGYLHIISIDMDGMKYINDNYGHLEGDHAIKSVANAINECFAQPCVSARFGGDEFMVAIFTEDGEKPTTDKISQKLNTYLKHSAMLADKEYEVGVSVGQAVVRLSEIQDLKTIEKLADDCMYEEKRKRKNSRR